MQIQKYSIRGSVVYPHPSSLIFFFIFWCHWLLAQNVGIGTSSPTATLHVNGTFRLSNGSEGTGKVLTSDATGKANWVTLPSSVPGGEENVSGYGDWLGCEAENLTAYQPIVGNQQQSFFGYQTAMNEQFAFVSAPTYDTMGIENAGIVVVYELMGNSWVEKQRLMDPNPESGNNFGNALACDNFTLVVGSPYDKVEDKNFAGSICIFTYNGSSWEFVERDSMNIPATGAIFGNSIDVKGDYLVVGAPNYGTVGRAFVYFKNGTDWQYLMDIVNPAGSEGDNFGGAVAISDNAIAIGASGFSQDSLHCGSVFTYIKISGSFFFGQQLLPDHYHFIRQNNANFGKYVDLDGDNLIVGVPRFKRYQRVIGAVAYYTFNGSAFVFNSAIYNDTDADPGGFEFTSLSGPYCFVAAPNNRVPGRGEQGKTYLYKMSAYGGTKIAEIIDPTGEFRTGNGMIALNHVTKRFVMGNSTIYTLRGKVVFGRIKI